MALIGVLAGVVGFLLRHQEVATVFDPVSGLAERGATITITLALFSLAVVALLFGLSFIDSKRTLSSFQEAFGGGIFGTLLLACLGLCVFALAGLEFMLLSERDGLDPFALARLGAALLAGPALMLTAILGWRGGNVAIPAALPVFWLCIWLIANHMDQASNPVLLSYVYQLFAIASLLLALYYVAGYAFRQEKPRRLLFFSSTALFFTGVTMGDPTSFYHRGTLLALAATVLIYQLTLTKNLARSA